MTQQRYIINRKLNILELGEVLGNISDACRRLGISRQHFYDIRAALAEEGIEGLVEKSRQSPRMGNRVAPWIEEALLNYSLEFPTHGQFRAANELKKKGRQERLASPRPQRQGNALKEARRVGRSQRAYPHRVPGRGPRE